MSETEFVERAVYLSPSLQEPFTGNGDGLYDRGGHWVDPSTKSMPADLVCIWKPGDETPVRVTRDTSGPMVTLRLEPPITVEAGTAFLPSVDTGRKIVFPKAMYVDSIHYYPHQLPRTLMNPREDIDYTNIQWLSRDVEELTDLTYSHQQQIKALSTKLTSITEELKHANARLKALEQYV